MFFIRTDIFPISPPGTNFIKPRSKAVADLCITDLNFLPKFIQKIQLLLELVLHLDSVSVGLWAGGLIEEIYPCHFLTLLGFVKWHIFSIGPPAHKPTDPKTRSKTVFHKNRYLSYQPTRNKFHQTSEQGFS